MLDTLREFLHIAAHFLGCNLRIYLRRADATVSQHLRESFDRYVVRQADRRGVGMAAHVETEKRYEQWKREESVT